MQDSKHDETGHIKNYANAEAIQKLKELAEGARICMFTTFSSKQPMPSRPMALQQVDENGALYFFSAQSSDKNAEILMDEHVQLFFANNGDSEYLSVFGKATISKDHEKIKELWNVFVKTWFQEGPDDPDITLIKVVPEITNYWDTKHNKMIALIKIGTSIITGKTMDDGVEGNLTMDTSVV